MKQSIIHIMRSKCFYFYWILISKCFCFYWLPVSIYWFLFMRLIDQVAVVCHPLNMSTYLIMIKSASSTFNFEAALDFYLIHQSEPILKDSIMDLFFLIQDICPESCYIMSIDWFFLLLNVINNIKLKLFFWLFVLNFYLFIFTLLFNTIFNVSLYRVIIKSVYILAIISFHWINYIMHQTYIIPGHNFSTIQCVPLAHSGTAPSVPPWPENIAQHSARQQL